MARNKKDRKIKNGIDQPKKHPKTGEMAEPNKHWVRHCLTGEIVQEDDWTPYCCSVAFERYFCM